MSIWFWLGLAVVAVLVLAPLGFIMYVLIGIGRAYSDHRRERAARRVHAVGGLGEFESSDGRVWLGEARGLTITIETSEDGPPGPAAAEGVRTLLDALPEHLERARAWLADGRWDERGPAGALEVVGVVWSADGSFSLELAGPDEDDPWTHEVRFERGEPVGATHTD